nr:hypothetical protein [Agrobacterium tumefaciens]
MWLYVPNISISSPSAQVDSDSISASNWQFQALEQSAWSRGKPSRSRNWYQQWKRAIWLQRLFGAMPEPSMAEHGVAQLTASLVASRASLIVSPAVSKGRTTNATSGLTLAASSSNQARGSCSSKTSPACFRRGLTKSLAQSGFAETFTNLASRWREDCSRRQKLARRTRENAYSSSQWPTPATRDHKGANSADHLENGTGRKHLDQLPNYVEHLWYTPNVPNGGRTLSLDTSPTGKTADGIKRQVGQYQYSRGDKDKPVPMLTGQALDMEAYQTSNTWPTPTAMNRPRSDKTLEKCRTRRKEKAGQNTVPLYLEDLASRIFLQGQEMPTDGEKYSPDRRSLNPLFVEWLMGWPPNWTLVAWIAFGCSEMELSHWKQRMRYALLSLGLPQEAPPAQLSLFG